MPYRFNAYSSNGKTIDCFRSSYFITLSWYPGDFSEKEWGWRSIFYFKAAQDKVMLKAMFNERWYEKIHQNVTSQFRGKKKKNNLQNSSKPVACSWQHWPEDDFATGFFWQHFRNTVCNTIYISRIVCNIYKYTHIYTIYICEFTNSQLEDYNDTALVEVIIVGGVPLGQVSILPFFKQ